ncbi:hypothetical protein Tco_1082493 [Tanacetum coccineum]|uniref:Uncharacterized protein n=1 Tax=Tanacetum coccineum TaxID=301880 RepID=A0ABQ5I0K9_9ASTR
MSRGARKIITEKASSHIYARGSPALEAPWHRLEVSKLAQHCWPERARAVSSSFPVISVVLSRVTWSPYCPKGVPKALFPTNWVMGTGGVESSSSIDDDSFSIDDIDYVEASPPDSELVILEEVKDFHTKDGETEDDILQNSSGSTTTRSDYSLTGYEALYFDDDHIEEKSSSSTTTHSDISLSKYDSFVFDSID